MKTQTTSRHAGLIKFRLVPTLLAGFQSDGLSPKRISPIGGPSLRTSWQEGRGARCCDETEEGKSEDEIWRDSIVSRLNLVEEKADERHEELVARLDRLTFLLQNCSPAMLNHAHPSSASARSFNPSSAPEKGGKQTGAAGGRSFAPVERQRDVREREGRDWPVNAGSAQPGNPLADEIRPEKGMHRYTHPMKANPNTVPKIVPSSDYGLPRSPSPILLLFGW